MINWNTLTLDLKKILNIQNEKRYLTKLVTDFEGLIEQDENIAYKIIGLKTKGFLIKASGIIGFISFNHMPWKYENIKTWKAIYPAIKGKIFFGRVHQFCKAPISLILNGEIPQFKIPELNKNERYKGIIINKTKWGAFIDIGFHFNWNCGSIVGMVHKSNFTSIEVFDQIAIGETIAFFYMENNKNGQPIFGDETIGEEWLNGDINKLIGEILPVKVVIMKDGSKSYLVNEKYSGVLPTKAALYRKKRRFVKEAVKNFEHGDLIHCEILKANNLNKTLLLKWDFAHEIEEILSRTAIEENETDRHAKEFKNRSNSIENAIDKNTIEKLNSIKGMDDNSSD